MYDKAELYYQDTELKAGIIVLDYKNNEVSAGRIKDSTGKLIQPPFFKQAGDEVNPDSIRFNFDTKKALIWNSRSEQSGMNVAALATKKENDSVYFIKEAKITTSKKELKLVDLISFYGKICSQLDGYVNDNKGIP